MAGSVLHAAVVFIILLLSFTYGLGQGFVRANQLKSSKITTVICWYMETIRLVLGVTLTLVWLAGCVFLHETFTPMSLPSVLTISIQLIWMLLLPGVAYLPSKFFDMLSIALYEGLVLGE